MRERGFQAAEGNLQGPQAVHVDVQVGPELDLGNVGKAPIESPGEAFLLEGSVPDHVGSGSRPRTLLVSRSRPLVAQPRSAFLQRLVMDSLRLRDPIGRQETVDVTQEVCHREPGTLRGVVLEDPLPRAAGEIQFAPVEQEVHVAQVRRRGIGNQFLQYPSAIGVRLPGDLGGDAKIFGVVRAG